MRFCKQICVFILIVLQSVPGQSKPEILDVTIDVKQNGIFIKFNTSVPVELHNITGWSAESGWFYITILGAISDSVAITNSAYKFPITNIQTANSGESRQACETNSGCPTHRRKREYRWLPPVRNPTKLPVSQTRNQEWRCRSFRQW